MTSCTPEEWELQDKSLIRKGPKGVTGEVVIQYTLLSIAKWITLISKVKYLTEHPAKFFSALTYPKHNKIMISSLDDHWKSKYQYTHTTTLTYSINIFTQTDTCAINSNRQNTTTNTRYFTLHHIPITKKYKKTKTNKSTTETGTTKSNIKY